MRRLLELALPARMGRSFRWLVTSSWTSNLGDGIGLAAGPLLIASQTRDPLLVALAALLQRLPWLVFGLWAGVLADRLQRRALVIGVDLGRAGVLALLSATIRTGTVVLSGLHELTGSGVSETPERGWYCFERCRRGGTIYDLAAPLYGLQAGGEDFRRLRTELRRTFALDAS